MSIKVQLALAEHFLNWYPFETKLYIRGERGKDAQEKARLNYELFDQLCRFFDKHGVTTLRNDLEKSRRQARAWRAVWECQHRLDHVDDEAVNAANQRRRAYQRLCDAVELAEGLDR